MYNCTSDADPQGSLAYSVCKVLRLHALQIVIICRVDTVQPGPALPMSDTLKNVIWIGDSLSIGYRVGAVAGLMHAA